MFTLCAAAGDVCSGNISVLFTWCVAAGDVCCFSSNKCNPHSDVKYDMVYAKLVVECEQFSLKCLVPSLS